MILRKKSINFDLWSNTHTNPYATRISIFGNKWSFFETCHFLEGPSVLTRNLVMGQIRVHGLISGWAKKETQFKFREGGRRQSKRGQRVVNREFRVGSNQRKPQKSKPPSEYTYSVVQSVPRHIFVLSSLAAGVDSCSSRFSSVRRVPALQGFSPFCWCLITQPASPLKHFCQDQIIVVGIIVGLLLSSGPCKINLFASSLLIPATSLWSTSPALCWRPP